MVSASRHKTPSPPGVSAAKLQRRSRVGRTVLLVVAAALLVLPVILVAHPISYFPLTSVVLLVIVSWLYLQLLRRSFSINVSQMATSCVRGEDTVLAVTLGNGAPVPTSRIEIEFFVTDLFGEYDDVRALTCTLGAHETSTQDFKVTFAHLGTYRAGVSRVVLHDLLGLFSAEIEQGAQRCVIVRPREVDLGGSFDLQAVPDENRSNLRPVAADDVDYASVREYRFGDPLKTVHWNLSSRNPDGGLYTRLFETNVNPSLAIIIDSYAPDLDAEDLMSLFDGMVETAAALSARAREDGIDAEVRFLGRDGEPGMVHLVTQSDADELVSRLRRIEPVGERAVEAGFAAQQLRVAGLRSHGFGNVALVTSRTDPEQIEALSSISMRRRNSMAFVAVPRMLEGKKRDRFLAPMRQLDRFGAPHYVVESTELRTEVIGV